MVTCHCFEQWHVDYNGCHSVYFGAEVRGLRGFLAVLAFQSGPVGGYQQYVGSRFGIGGTWRLFGHRIC